MNETKATSPVSSFGLPMCRLTKSRKVNLCYGALSEKKGLVTIQCTKYGKFSFLHPGAYLSWNMEGLAGYDSSSSDENAKIQLNSADKQVRNAAER